MDGGWEIRWIAAFRLVERKDKLLHPGLRDYGLRYDTSDSIVVLLGKAAPNPSELSWVAALASVS